MLAIFSCATLVLLWSLTELRTREVQARIYDANSLFAEHIERVFISINWLADSAGRAFLYGSHDLEMLRVELERINSTEAYSLQLGIVDLKGKFILSNVTARGGVDLSDREHIRVHLMDGAPDIFISRPLIGRVSNKPSINVSKRFHGSDGQVAGIVVVSYDPLMLNSFFERHEFEPNGTIALLRSDGTLIARSRTSQSLIGSDVSDSVIFRDYIGRGMETGTATLRSRFDGIFRLYKFKVLPKLALVVVTGGGGVSLIEGIGSLYLLGGAWNILLLALLILGGSLLKRHEREVDKVGALHLSQSKADNLANLLQSAFYVTGIFVVIFDLSKSADEIFANETARDLFASLPDKDTGRLRLIDELRGNYNAQSIRATQRISIKSHANDGEHSRIVCWTMTLADWVSADAVIAIGFDRTEVEKAEHALYQKSRLVSLGEIVTSISHELAQPLTVISFAASMIAKGSGSADSEMHELLMKASERVARTVNRMKLFGRQSENGTGVFTLRDCVETVEALMQNDLKLARINLVIEPSEEEVIVSGDLVLFEQVLLNLLLNGRDAINENGWKEGQEELRISFGRRGDGMAFVRVSDTGPGIPNEIASRIFDPFFTTKKNGTGLGLSLSFGTVRQMGGGISMSSTDKGAVFEVIVPAAAA